MGNSVDPNELAHYGDGSFGCTLFSISTIVISVTLSVISDFMIEISKR